VRRVSPLAALRRPFEGGRPPRDWWRWLGVLLLAGSTVLLAAVQVGTRAGNFGMIQPARESLFTRVDRETRYKAKNFIDTVVYRGGDALAGWLFAGLGGAAFVAAGIAAGWTALGVHLGHRIRTWTPSAAPSSAFSPQERS
jgi:AAA family ATP:ADP antiporter